MRATQTINRSLPLKTLLFVAACCQLVARSSGSGLATEDKYSCPHGWTRYGNKKCLKYVNELQDYERAQATCRSKNQGSLVTVHSHDEQNFVYSYIHSIAASSAPIWLGAKQIDFESILWLDKSENSYTNWAPSEPSHPDKICIAINPRTGMWHDVMCTEANVPACERAPTTQWPFFVAFCSEGWFQFNDEKCVRIISSQALNFYESQELCRSKYNSKLLSIKSDRESEFLHNLIKFRDVKLPVWLGAVQNDFSSFNWIDKTDVTFTNWAESEPNDPDHACLSMTASGGKWADNDCKEQKLILCQKVPEDSACETGWLQFRQDKCYRFVHIRLAFDDAESLCNHLYGGHLPSIHSQEEQFMISQFLASVNVKNGSEIWLGGRQVDFHNFNWADGSLFNYSYWDHAEPSFPAEKCIEMSWRNGRWNDINCRLKRAVLCERQVMNRHQMKPILYQPAAICLDSSNCTGSAGQQQPQQASNGSSLLAGHSSGGASMGANGSPAADSPLMPSQVASLEGDASGGGANFSLAGNEAAAAAANQTSRSSTAGDPHEPQGAMAGGLVGEHHIKVVSSIMHREPPLGSEQPLVVQPNGSPAVEASSPGVNFTSPFIHYNLPPPDSVDQEPVGRGDRPLPASEPEMAQPDHLSDGSANRGSLMDKIKPSIVAAPKGELAVVEKLSQASNATSSPVAPVSQAPVQQTAPMAAKQSAPSSQESLPIVQAGVSATPSQQSAQNATQ